MTERMLLVYGDPVDGFTFVGPVTPNDPDLDRYVDTELRNVTWFYVPLRTLDEVATEEPQADPADLDDGRPCELTVIDLQLRIRVKHADYELAYGNGVGDLPDYATEQASEAVKEQLRRLGWGEVWDVKSSHWTTAAVGEPGDPWCPMRYWVEPFGVGQGLHGPFETELEASEFMDGDLPGSALVSDETHKIVPRPKDGRPFTKDEVRAEVMSQIPADYSPTEIDGIVDDVLAGKRTPLRESVDRSIQGLDA